MNRIYPANFVNPEILSTAVFDQTPVRDVICSCRKMSVNNRAGVADLSECETCLLVTRRGRLVTKRVVLRPFELSVA